MRCLASFLLALLLIAQPAFAGSMTLLGVGSASGCTAVAKTQTLISSPSGAPTYTFDTTGVAATDYVLVFIQNVLSGVVMKFSDGTTLAQLDDQTDTAQRYVIYGGVLNATNLAAATITASGAAMTATEPVNISTWRGAGTATSKAWNFAAAGVGTLVLTGFPPSANSCGVAMVGTDENSLSAGFTIAGSPGTWTALVNGVSTPSSAFFTNYLFLNIAYANADTTFQTYETTANQGSFLVEFTP